MNLKEIDKNEKKDVHLSKVLSDYRTGKDVSKEDKDLLIEILQNCIDRESITDSPIANDLEKIITNIDSTTNNSPEVLKSFVLFFRKKRGIEILNNEFQKNNLSSINSYDIDEIKSNLLILLEKNKNFDFFDDYKTKYYLGSLFFDKLCEMSIEWMILLYITNTDYFKRNKYFFIVDLLKLHTFDGAFPFYQLFKELDSYNLGSYRIINEGSELKGEKIFYDSVLYDKSIYSDVQINNLFSDYLNLNNNDNDPIEYTNYKNVINYNSLSLKYIIPIFVMFKNEFYNLTNYDYFIKLDDENCYNILSNVINNMLSKNIFLSYLNLNFYIIRSNSILILYENLLCQIWIYNKPSHKYVDLDNCVDIYAIGYIDGIYDRCELNTIDRKFSIDLSLPKISESKKSSISNSAMIGGALFGTTGALIGATKAYEKNKKIDEYNNNHEPIIYNSSYKTYMVELYLSNGLKKFYISSDKKLYTEPLLEFYNKLKGIIDSSKIDCEKMFNKLKINNDYMDNINELKNQILQKNREIGQLGISFFGKKLEQKKEKQKEIDNLNNELSEVCHKLQKEQNNNDYEII